MSSSDQGAPGPEAAFRFLAWAAASGALLGLLLVLLAWLLDPTGLVSARWPRSWAVCEPGIRIDQRTALPFLPALRRPRVVILGTSRVRIGMSEADAVPLFGPSVVNMGISSASFDEIANLFDAVLAVGSAEHVLIGVDFGMFHGDGVERPVTPADIAGAGDIRGAALRQGLLAPGTWQAALRVLLQPSQCAAPDRGPNGFERPGVSIPGTGASRDTFERAALALDRDMAIRAGPGLERAEAAYAASMRRLESVANAAQARRVRLTLFINPSHPRYFEAVRRAGLADRYRGWQADLAEIAAASGAGIDLLDFTGWQEPCAEECGSHGAGGSSDCGFYDPTHYRPAVGKLIMREALRGTKPASAGLPGGEAGFGRLPCRIRPIVGHGHITQPETSTAPAPRLPGSLP